MLNLGAMASGCTIFGDPTVNGEVMLTILDDNRKWLLINKSIDLIPKVSVPPFNKL